MALPDFLPRPKRGWKSLRKSIWRNARRVLIALTFAVLVTVTWHQFHKYGLHLPHGASEMLGVSILVLAAIFAIAGAMILTGVWDHVTKVSEYVLLKKKRKFMVARDEHMPFAMHLVLCVSGFFVLVLLGAADYPTSASGAFIICITSSAIAYFYLVIVGVERTVEASVWFKEQIPEDWLAEPADKYFKEVGERRKARKKARRAHESGAKTPEGAPQGASEATRAPRASSPNTPAAS